MLAASQASPSTTQLWAVAEKVGDLRSQVSDPAFPRSPTGDAGGHPRPVLRHEPAQNHRRREHALGLVARIARR